MSELENDHSTEYDFAYLDKVYEEAGSPYDKLARYAVELGLQKYAPIIESDAVTAKQRAAFAAVNAVGTGLIHQADLAYQLAYIEDDFRTARAEVGSMTINGTMIEKLIDEAESTANKQQRDLLKFYKSLAREYVTKMVENMAPSVDEMPVPDLDDNEIKAAYDTSPITKDQFVQFAGTKVKATRNWRPLANLCNSQPRSSRGQRDIIGPELLFGIKPNDGVNPRHHSDENMSDLDFVSFYKFVNWLNQTLEEHDGIEVSDILGRNVGPKAVEFYNRFILSRATR